MSQSDDRRNALRVVFAGGGTGGHIYPALAVADRLRARHPEAAVLFIGTGRLEATKVPAAGYELRQITVHGLAGQMSSRRRTAAILELLLGRPLWQSIGLLRRFRPHVVVGTGGYVSGPVWLAAWILGVPAMALELNQHPGLATRIGLRLVQLAAAVSRSAAGELQARRPQLRIEVVGSPIRPEILTTTRAEGQQALGLDPKRLTLLAIGGSIGSQAINRALIGALESLAQEPWFRDGVQVIHLTGSAHPEHLSSARAAELGLAYQAREYLDDMHFAYAATDLAVSRGGAMTVAELAVAGVPAIIIPWSGAANNEQELNARPLVDAGGAVLLHDNELEPGRLADLLRQLLQGRERLTAMRGLARGVSRPEAADRVVDLIEELAGRPRVAPAAGGRASE